jgi:MoxR-like ATPase
MEEDKKNELENNFSSYLPKEENNDNTTATPIPTEANTEPSLLRGNQDVIWVAQKAQEVRKEMSKYIIGQQETIELMLIGVLCNGHLLLEGVPGVAKTLSSKVMAKTLDVHFSRIQFTPDLMPADVIGTSVFQMKEGTFHFKRGPIFSNIVLIDEINRAPAKTQSALFEVMEERQLTYDGVKYPMEFPFLVIATQNPIEQEGTYSLPEAQLDRFLFKLKIDYPTLEEEQEIMIRYKSHLLHTDTDNVQAVLHVQDLRKIQSILEKVIVEDHLIKYIAQIINETRNHAKIYLGASPRASLSILKAAKSMAILRGRDFVSPDDIQFVAKHVLNHRLILTAEAEMDGLSTELVLESILQNLEVPR